MFRFASGEQRLTQQQLADRIGVSVETLSKWERSLHFPDLSLESIVQEALGWTASEIQEVRLDWQLNFLSRKKPNYRIIDSAYIERRYKGSFDAFTADILKLDDEEIDNLTEEFSGSVAQWSPIFRRDSDMWGAVVQGDEIVANWHVVALNEDAEANFRHGSLADGDIREKMTIRPYLDGQYFGYIPAVVVASGHLSATTLLQRSFVQFIERFAREGRFFRGIGAISVTPDGDQFCDRVGMDMIGEYSDRPNYRLWELKGKDLPKNTLTKKSPIIRNLYAEAAARFDWK